MGIIQLFGAKYLSSQALLAQVLRQTQGFSPLPAIATGAQGKPFFPAHPALHFNLSHSGDYVLCAWGDQPVGVDIECIKARAGGLPRYALSDAEYADYCARGGHWPDFYALWTRKEAWIKYSGYGLGSHWRQTPCLDGLHFTSYQTADYCATLCAATPGPPEICWLTPSEHAP